MTPIFPSHTDGDDFLETEYSCNVTMIRLLLYGHDELHSRTAQGSFVN